MNNKLTTTNQNAKLAHTKSKNLLDITNSILHNRIIKKISFHGVMLHTSLGHGGSINSVTISQDSKYIVSGNSSDRIIRLLDIASGELIRSFKMYDSMIKSVAVTSDAKYFVNGSYDKTIRLWDIASGEEIRSFDGHRD